MCLGNLKYYLMKIIGLNDFLKFAINPNGGL